MLADGSYDAIVIDASTDGAALTVELTILAGDHKGEVVAVRAEGLGRDALDLLGLPATLTVTNGVPALTLDE